MAGTHINISARGHTQVAKALNQLLKQGQNLSPVLGDIAEYLLESRQHALLINKPPTASHGSP